MVISPQAIDDPESDDLISRFDGLILMGGGDVNPALYGQAAGPHIYGVLESQDHFEASMLQAALRRHLGLPPPIASAPGPVESHYGTILAALVHASAQSQGEKVRAYRRAMDLLRVAAPPELASAPSPEEVSAALAAMLRLGVPARREVVRACGVAMLHDGRAEPAEIEMVRAVGDSLGIVFPTGF